VAGEIVVRSRCAEEDDKQQFSPLEYIIDYEITLDYDIMQTKQLFLHWVIYNMKILKMFGTRLDKNSKNT
jgi:hypothetical protein